MIGKVLQVFIPGDNILESNKIGFKVLLNDKIIEIIQDQNVENIDILKDDNVFIIKNDDSSYDISLYYEV